MALVTWFGKTVTKNCAGAMPAGRLQLQRLVAMVPSWLLKQLLLLLLLLLLPHLLPHLLQHLLLQPK